LTTDRAIPVDRTGARWRGREPRSGRAAIGSQRARAEQRNKRSAVSSAEGWGGMRGWE
jgi:hypothetical protein